MTAGPVKATSLHSVLFLCLFPVLCIGASELPETLNSTCPNILLQQAEDVQQAIRILNKAIAALSESPAKLSFEEVEGRYRAKQATEQDLIAARAQLRQARKEVSETLIELKQDVAERLGEFERSRTTHIIYIEKLFQIQMGIVHNWKKDKALHADPVEFVRELKAAYPRYDELQELLMALQQVKGSSPAQKRLAHDILNVMNPAAMKHSLIQVYLENGIPQSNQDIQEILGSMENTLMRCAILTSSFHSRSSGFNPEKMAIASVFLELEKVLGKKLHHTDLAGPDLNLQVSIDLDGVLRSLANMRRNAEEALIKSGRRAEELDFEVRFRVMRAITADELSTDKDFIDLAQGKARRTLVFGCTEQPYAYLTIVFQDHAGGIPLELIPSLFVEGVTGHIGEDRGRGMASVAEQMAFHDGWIRLETNRLGNEPGTTIRLNFPISSAAEAQRQPPTPSPSDPALIVVMKNPVALYFTGRLLDRALAARDTTGKMHVVMFQNREDALKALRGNLHTPFAIFLNDDDEDATSRLQVWESVDELQRKSGKNIYRTIISSRATAYQSARQRVSDFVIPADFSAVHLDDILSEIIP